MSNGIQSTTVKRLGGFYEGKKAFYNNDWNNPYTPETIAWREWNHGRDVGYLETLKRVTNREARA
jgi:hypothetical protein